MKKNEGAQRRSRQKHVSRKRRGFSPAIAIKMKVKKGDTVMVISGKDKGKTGEIITVLPKENRVVIDGVGMIKRHMRGTGKNQSGRIIERPSSIHASNVMVLDPESKKPTRIHRLVENGKTVRVAAKSKAVIK